MHNKIQVQEVNVKAERRKYRLKVALISTLGILVLAGGATLAWYLTPPAMPASIEEAGAVVQSVRFQRLSKEGKQPYYDVIREQFGSLDRDQRRAMMQDDEAVREAGEDFMKKMIHQYVLATPEQRKAMEALMPRPGNRRPDGQPRPEGASPDAPPSGGGAAGAPATNPGGEGPPGGRDPGKMREHINDRMANGDAQMNQLVGEMFKQMREQNQSASPR